jgi:hypothetical protein
MMYGQQYIKFVSLLEVWPFVICFWLKQCPSTLFWWPLNLLFLGFLMITHKNLDPALKINNIDCCVHSCCKFYCSIRVSGGIHSFHWHMHNATIKCLSQELLPFLSVIYFFLPLFCTDYSPILPNFILLSICWSTSWSCCFHFHAQYSFGDYIFFHSLYMSKPM